MIGQTSSPRVTRGAQCDPRGERDSIDDQPRIPTLGGWCAAVIDLAVEHIEGGFDVERQPIPTIEVVRDGVRLVFRTRCPYCRVRHAHDAHSSVHPGVEECPCPRHPDYHRSRGPCLCPLGSADGHRGEHCFEPSSPYHRTGYVLREVKS
jgi:hypothetical protein